MTKAKAATMKEVELNRWCIEMAICWPVIHAPAIHGNASAGMQQMQMYQQSQPARDVDADVIGRAAKIRTWVKSVA